MTNFTLDFILHIYIYRYIEIYILNEWQMEFKKKKNTFVTDKGQFGESYLENERQADVLM